MTFAELCRRYSVTPDERRALVWHLAAFRMRKTVEALLAPGDVAAAPEWMQILRDSM